MTSDPAGGPGGLVAGGPATDSSSEYLRGHILLLIIASNTIRTDL